MKNSTDVLFISAAIAFFGFSFWATNGCNSTQAASLPTVAVHTCIDPLHVNCVDFCDCDGSECPAPSGVIVRMNESGDSATIERGTEYQFNVDTAGYDLYSGDRFLGRINYGDNPTLDSVIRKDNQ